MLRTIPFLAFLAITSLPAADLAGNWAGTVEINGRQMPFYLALNLNAGKVNGFASTVKDAARSMRVENSELRDDSLFFEIHDDANRLVQFRLTLSSGVLGGQATVDAEVWKVAIVPVASSSGAAIGAGIGGSVYRVGGGVSAPVLIHKVEPEYTGEARAAKYQGTVSLYVEIRTDGTATNIRVLRSLGLGLDQKAIECVQRWIFKPGEKDGKPVTVAATIEVNFRM